jgi:dTDP-glucose 4,6-dehydratase
VDRSFWNGKTVLLAGATGFLGGWLVRRLLSEQARLICIVRRDKPKSQFAMDGFAKRTILETGSLYHAGFIERVFTKHRIDAFFHAGYGADVNRVLREPFECFRSTAESTWLCLDVIRRLQPSCVSVISSTDKAYGTQSLPYEESNALTPMHPYEVAKASQDLAAQSFGKIYGLPVAVTRCGNYFGGYDFNFTRLIPGVCKSLASSKRPMLRSDGRFTRDFLYIEDAVDAQLLVAEALFGDPRIYGEAFNFSYGEQFEVIDIVRRLTKLAGQNLEPVIEGSTRAEIRDMRLSSKKAADVLGWRPRCGFDEGLRRTLQWYDTYFREKDAKVPFFRRGPILNALLFFSFSSNLLVDSL